MKKIIFSFIFFIFLPVASMYPLSKQIDKSWFFCFSKNNIHFSKKLIQQKCQSIDLPVEIKNYTAFTTGYYKKKLIFKKRQNSKDLGVILGFLKTSAEIFFNGKKIYEYGKTGKNFVDASKKLIYFKIPKNLIHMKNNILLIKFQSNNLAAGFYKGPFIMDTYENILKKAYKIENRIKFTELFLLGNLFIIILFCFSLYFNKVVDKEYLSFGFFILCYMIYFFLNSSFFYSTGEKNFFMQKLCFVFLIFTPLSLHTFLAHVTGVKQNLYIKTLNAITLLIALLYTFSLESLDPFFIKQVPAILYFIYVSLSGYHCFKTHQKEYQPEIVWGIIGSILLLIAIVSDFFQVISANVLDYGIFVFIICIINGLTSRFGRIGKERQNFSLQLISSRDDERKKLGKNLHDGLGQLLIAIKLNLQMHSKTNKNLFSKLIDEVSNALSELRNICENLKPAILDNMGISYSIKYMLDKYASDYKVSYNTNVEPNEKIPNYIEENLFRIFQECLNNCLKHSNADRINVSLIKKNNLLLFSFNDNGKGFVAGEKKGIGFLSIKERVYTMKGKIEIITKNKGKNSGVAINIEIPLRGAE